MSSAAEDLLAGEVIRPLRREEYEQLVELGAFDDEQVELLYGRIVEMPPQGPAHDGTIERLSERLMRALALPERAAVRVQLSFLGPSSVPIPDLAVVPRDDHRAKHPDRAHLIVEVSRTTLRKDRGVKARLYAECGVPEYWVMNVRDGLVEVHTEPAGDHYARVQPYRRGDRIRLVDFPDVEIAVDDLLG
jgi:Uma2 family endonuclease